MARRSATIYTCDKCGVEKESDRPLKTPSGWYYTANSFDEESPDTWAWNLCGKCFHSMSCFMGKHSRPISGDQSKCCWCEETIERE